LKRVCIVEPVLTQYFFPVALELAERVRVDLIYSPRQKEYWSAFDDVAGQSSLQSSMLRLMCVPTFRPFGRRIGMYQSGVLRYLWTTRPNSVFISANARCLSFWLVIIVCRILGLPVHAWGHGLYRRGRASRPLRLVYAVMLRLLTSYICYTDKVLDSLVENGLDGGKLSVGWNTLKNEHPVLPAEKNGMERGILFIGRLRENSGIALLCRVVKRLRTEAGYDIKLHIVGDGPERHLIERERALADVIFHGATYDYHKIAQISRLCAVGCYAGNAGLSVVHYMSLSLVPVVHNRLASHQGPEPGYITNGTNGILFEQSPSLREASLYEALKSLFDHPGHIRKMQEMAFHTYQRLANPSLATRFLRILLPGC